MQKTISITCAASALSISRGKLYQLIGSGLLTTVRIGRRHLVKVDSIDAFIEANTQILGVSGGDASLQG